MSRVHLRSFVGRRRGAGSSMRDLLPQAPAGWVSAREVAELRGGIQVRAARLWLKRKGFKKVFVKDALRGFRCYWEGAAVRRALVGRPEVVPAIPAGWCCSAEVGVILGCSRSSVSRHAELGRFAAWRVRVRSATGWRCLLLYKRAQVRGYKRAREAAARAAQCARVARLYPEWAGMENRAVFQGE